MFAATEAVKAHANLAAAVTNDKDDSTHVTVSLVIHFYNTGSP